jgi:hypothetical protein
MFESLSNDPLFSLLRSFGYNTVRLPRATIKPLQMFAKKKRQSYPLGSISSVFKTREDVFLPTITENQKASNISGKQSGELSLGVGFSILNSILSAFGGSAIGLDVAYKQARTISFQYEDVLEDSIEMAQLDQFLNAADINLYSKCVGDLLEADQVYVTSSVIKSQKFSILPQASKETKLDIKIPEIQKIVGGNVKVYGKGEDSSVITFEGSTPLVFGFQGWQLFYDKGKITRIEPVQKVMLGLPEKNSPKLIGTSPFISIAE